METYGCALNTADSETMRAILEKDGFIFTNNIDESDVIIINSCTVKLSTFNRFGYILKKYGEKYASKGKKIIVAGCITQTNPEMIKDISLVGVEQIDKITEVVSETLLGNVVQMTSRKDLKRLDLPKVRRNEIIDIVPVSKGCLGSCSYCKVKFARGTLRSYNPRDIIRHIIKGLNEGIKEVWLTSQDTGAYGQDLKISIIDLIERILAIKKDFKIRLGMANPDFVHKYLDGFAKIFENEKMFRFLHVPLQSGSDNVLKDMRRKYTSSEYEEIISVLRNKFPDITIATDIICGFPTETENDFKETLDIMKRTMPDIINISKYSSMDLTDASGFKQLPSETIKNRSQKMTLLHKEISLKRNKYWLGWEGNAMIDEKGKKGGMIARNDSYKPIILEGDHSLGNIINVKIKKTTDTDLRT